MVRPELALALALGCGSQGCGGPSPATPRSVASSRSPGSTAPPACAVADETAPSEERWRTAFPSTHGGYVFVVDAPPPLDARVRSAVEALGARETEVVECGALLVVWLPADNLEMGRELEDSIAVQWGARVRSKAILRERGR